MIVPHIAVWCSLAGTPFVIRRFRFSSVPPGKCRGFSSIHLSQIILTSTLHRLTHQQRHTSNYACNNILFEGPCREPGVHSPPSYAEGWIQSQVSPVELVVDKVSLGHASLRIIQLSPASIIPLALRTYYSSPIPYRHSH